jgi:hypothetical protein
MVIACISCCSNATGPIANTAKTSLINTTMMMITTTTTIAVQRSPNTIHWIGPYALKRIHGNVLDPPLANQ